MYRLTGTWWKPSSWRLVGVTTSEAEFTPTDVSALLAVRAQDAEVGPHGYPMSEALDPASEGKFTGHVKTDHIAAALITAQDRYYEQYPNAKRGAHHWTASRIEPKTGGES